MTPSDIGSSFVWLLVFVLGIGTYGLRLSFMHFQDSLSEVPPPIEHGLAFIPAAILAALVCAELFTLESLVTGTAINTQVIAEGLAFIVAWWTKSIPITIGVGLVARSVLLWW